MTYEEVEQILAEIITEATGEPRVGRFERTLAKAALKRLRDAGMTLSSGDPSPSGPASQLDRGINTPSRDHTDGSEL